LRATTRGLPLFRIVALAVVFFGSTGQRGLRAQQAKTDSDQTKASLAIIALHPDATAAGQAFNAQPDGTSAIAVSCKGATKTTLIVFDGEKLPTVYGGPTLLTARVPSRLYSKSGRHDVYLISEPSQKSNIAKFTVR
jgi:hypothetical protein